MWADTMVHPPLEPSLDGLPQDGDGLRPQVPICDIPLVRPMADWEIKRYNASITKAINHHECPVKEKHVRSTIIGTFHEKGASTFWARVVQLPLQDNPIVCWKFCHVLHKVLREGHAQVILQSMRERSKLEELGTYWKHLKDGYGKLIHHYTKLLVAKLDFHRRNPRFPGSLMLSSEDELDVIGDNDINNYFQLAVEMFDYMDEILNLQKAVFGSLDMSRSNSMTSCGQCRLAPLIPCIQDSSQLYDYCVRILFRLHASLPPDILTGHRDRFLKQFKELRTFYHTGSMLQYFRYLIQVPTLPEEPPNFLLQSDLRSYVTPVPVVIQSQESPEAEGADFVDTSDSGSMPGDLVDLTIPSTSSQNGLQSSSATIDALVERDSLINHLQQELAKMKAENQRIEARYLEQLENLRERINDLERDLVTKESELMAERELKDDLLLQTDNLSKSEETEKRARVAEEKFQRLKEVYAKLRGEHIQLIREKAALEKELRVCDRMSQFAQAANRLIVSIKAGVDKQLETALSVGEDAKRRSLEIELQMQEMMEKRSTAEEVLVRSANQEKQLEQQQEQVKNLEEKLLILETEKVDLEKQLVEAKKQFVSIEKEMINSKKRDEQQLLEILGCCVGEAERVVKAAVHEVDNPAISALTCTPDYFRTLVDPMLDSLSVLDDRFGEFREELTFPGTWSQLHSLVSAALRAAHSTALCVVHGRTTSNTAPDIEFGENMAGESKNVGEAVLSLLASIKEMKATTEIQMSVLNAKSKMATLMELVERLTGLLKGDSTEMIGDMLETELASMDKAIEEAAQRIVEMLAKSRAGDSGLKLEVNEKILDSCTTLMKAIHMLVRKARFLQAEIVAQGKGKASAKEFYKRNHQWTEGLISAAKAIGMGAKFLLTAADKVVSGQGKLEALVVASNQVAASTAQLVVASRVKASRGSENLRALLDASRSVTQATGNVVATSKDCSQLIEESEEFDVSGLTLHQAKRLEMDSQVRVLELEASLQQERLRLAALRRHHYQLAGEVEGWEIMDKP